MDEPDCETLLSATDPHFHFSPSMQTAWFSTSSLELPHYGVSVSALDEGSPQVPRGLPSQEINLNSVPKLETDGRMPNLGGFQSRDPDTSMLMPNLLSPANGPHTDPAPAKCVMCRPCDQTFNRDYRKDNLARHSTSGSDKGRQHRTSLPSKLFYMVAAGVCALGDTGAGHKMIDRGMLQGLGVPISPERTTTLLCIAGFTISTTCLYRSSPNDQHQDLCLILGIISGVGIGLPIGMSLYDVILRVLPWTVLMSLLMSGIMHTILRRCCKTGNRLDEELEQSDVVGTTDCEEYCEVQQNN